VNHINQGRTAESADGNRTAFSAGTEHADSEQDQDQEQDQEQEQEEEHEDDSEPDPRNRPTDRPHAPGWSTSNATRPSPKATACLGPSRARALSLLRDRTPPLTRALMRSWVVKSVHNAQAKPRGRPSVASQLDVRVNHVHQGRTAESAGGNRTAFSAGTEH
jgi:hypothetical protein